MPTNTKIDTFLSQYDEPIFIRALKLRGVILACLPNIIEEVDLPAKMVAYSHGKKYVDMICTIIPSKKGLKLGFYKGNELPDPGGLLEGSGKISRYVVIHSDEQIQSGEIKELLENALNAYRQRMSSIKK